MTVHLVRHAHAVSRQGHHDADIDRPLDDRGTAQASALAALPLFDVADRILSSPAVRCVETVRPLAERLGLPLETDHRLYEGHDPGALLDLVMGASSQHGDLVLCSHGDLIPELLRLVTLRGAELIGQRMVEKGSVWSIEFENGRPLTARHTPAPA